MDDRFKLSDEDHERYYRDIEADLLRNSRPVEHPRVIITGGQPGSGKSKLLESAKKEFPDGNVVVINGDDLREYHPRADEIFKLDDKRFAERTDPDSRAWTKRLFDRAIETKRNIIFESTMRDPGPISKTMERLKEEGYHLTAKVVATHERMSTTGIYRRYEEQKAEKGYGRWSELSSHDAGYEGMPKTVEHIEHNKLVDCLEVYNRDGEQLYSNELKRGQWEKAPDAVQAIKTERERTPTEKELRSLQADWQRIDDLMHDRKAPEREIEQARSTYQKIERDLSKPREQEKPKENPKPQSKLFQKLRDAGLKNKAAERPLPKGPENKPQKAPEKKPPGRDDITR